jgi:hypothetical protein
MFFFVTVNIVSFYVEANTEAAISSMHRSCMMMAIDLCQYSNSSIIQDVMSTTMESANMNMIDKAGRAQ